MLISLFMVGGLMVREYHFYFPQQKQRMACWASGRVQDSEQEDLEVLGLMPTFHV